MPPLLLLCFAVIVFFANALNHRQHFQQAKLQSQTNHRSLAINSHPPKDHEPASRRANTNAANAFKASKAAKEGEETEEPAEEPTGAAPVGMCVPKEFAADAPYLLDSFEARLGTAKLNIVVDGSVVLPKCPCVSGCDDGECFLNCLWKDADKTPWPEQLNKMYLQGKGSSLCTKEELKGDENKYNRNKVWGVTVPGSRWRRKCDPKETEAIGSVISYEGKWNICEGLFKRFWKHITGQSLLETSALEQQPQRREMSLRPPPVSLLDTRMATVAGGDGGADEDENDNAGAFASDAPYLETKQTRDKIDEAIANVEQAAESGETLDNDMHPTMVPQQEAGVGSNDPQSDPQSDPQLGLQNDPQQFNSVDPNEFTAAKEGGSCSGAITEVTGGKETLRPQRIKCHTLGKSNMISNPIDQCIFCRNANHNTVKNFCTSCRLSK